MSQQIVKAILKEIQNLDEIGGPETPEEYISCLEKVKAEIEKRIETAKSQME